MPAPEGFAVVTPYIFADSADRYIRFLVAAFAATEVGRTIAPDGTIANCQLRIDDAMVMVSDASADFPAGRAAFYLYVADADAAMTRAEAAGAVRVMDVADMPYGDRQGGVRDPGGNIWWISQRLTDAAYFPAAASPAA